MIFRVKMTNAQVLKVSVINNSDLSEDYSHPDNHTRQLKDYYKTTGPTASSTLLHIDTHASHASQFTAQPPIIYDCLFKTQLFNSREGGILPPALLIYAMHSSSSKV